MALTDTQSMILSKAARHADRIAEPPATLPPAPRAAVAKAMLKAGLLVRAEATQEQDAGLAWKLDGQDVILRVSEAGLLAIGVEVEDVAAADPGTLGMPQDGMGEVSDYDQPISASAGAQDGREASLDAVAGGYPGLPLVAAQEGHQAAAADEGHRDAGSAARAALGAPAAQERHGGRNALHDVAQAVLAAWDDAIGERHGLPEAIEHLRTVLAKPVRMAGPIDRPRAPRQGTKQEQVLALLRRPEGASDPQMIDATGWAAHTVRGFLAGLPKMGITVTVLERVRQVGPNKAGAKGSYTVYRIGEAG